MTTAAYLSNYTMKDLATMAKKKGVSGWHSMRKDQLVRALVRKAKSKAESAKNARAKKPASKVNSPSSSHGITSSKNGSRKNVKNFKDLSGNGRAAAAKSSRKSESPVAKSKRRGASGRIRKANAQRQHLKDLSGAHTNGKADGAVVKDRAVLMVRDPYWLHAYWEVSSHSIQRARAAMAEQWHTAKPTLRLLEVDDGSTTSTTERIARDIEIHGGVNNWYIDVQNPPTSFRFALGYLASDGKFFALVRSNSVTTPSPSNTDLLDENWMDVAENYERIYALSGGYSEDGASAELQELFEERLRRPMGSPIVTRYGIGAEGMLSRGREFWFEVDAELIVFGATKPNAYVTLAGEPVKLRPDGTFTVRLGMPDRRQVLPVVANSGDGVEQRTVVLAIERNTKVMEPRIRDTNE